MASSRRGTIESIGSTFFSMAFTSSILFFSNLVLIKPHELVREVTLIRGMVKSAPSKEGMLKIPIQCRVVTYLWLVRWYYHGLQPAISKDSCHVILRKYTIWYATNHS